MYQPPRSTSPERGGIITLELQWFPSQSRPAELRGNPGRAEGNVNRRTRGSSRVRPARRGGIRVGPLEGRDGGGRVSSRAYARFPRSLLGRNGEIWGAPFLPKISLFEPGRGATRAQISRHDSQIGSEDNDFFGERVNASRCYQKRGTPSRQKTHRTRLNLPPRYAASLRPRTRAYHARPSGGRPARRRRRDSAPSRWTWREKNDGPMISLCQAGASNRRRARGDASPYPALATR